MKYRKFSPSGIFLWFVTFGLEIVAVLLLALYTEWSIQTLIGICMFIGGLPMLFVVYRWLEGKYLRKNGTLVMGQVKKKIVERRRNTNAYRLQYIYTAPSWDEYLWIDYVGSDIKIWSDIQIYVYGCHSTLTEAKYFF